MLVQVIVAVLASTSLSALVTAWFNRSKVRADTASTLVSTSTELLDTVVVRLDAAERRLVELEAGITALTAQIRDLGHHPVWPVGGWPVPTV